MIVRTGVARSRLPTFAFLGYALLSTTAAVSFAGPRGTHGHSPTGNPVTAVDSVEVTVYKSPSCGCCKRWAEHLGRHGFRVLAKDTSDVSAVKATLGVPANLHSCHTAVVHGYVIEGHVPADVIERLLRERPKIAGLAVPGMPAGSPGMETRGAADQYEVLAFTREGSSSVYEKR